METQTKEDKLRDGLDFFSNEIVNLLEIEEKIDIKEIVKLASNYNKVIDTYGKR